MKLRIFSLVTLFFTVSLSAVPANPDEASSVPANAETRAPANPKKNVVSITVDEATVKIPTGKLLHITHFTNPVATLKAIINQHPQVVIKFSADWCGPCKEMARTIQEVAPDFTNVIFLDVDVEEFPPLAAGIGAMPTLRFYKQAIKVKETRGTIPKNSFKALLTAIFG